MGKHLRDNKINLLTQWLENLYVLANLKVFNKLSAVIPIARSTFA